MPQELLSFPPIYLLVGIYRLTTDPKLWYPIWKDCKSTIKSTILISIGTSIITLPLTNLWVKFFMNSTSLLRYTEESFFWKLSVQRIAVFSIWIGQLKSRNKPNSFWAEYFEEWEIAPVLKAKRRLRKRGWYNTLSGPFVRFFVLKVLLIPLHFVPFLNTIIISLLSSLTFSETQLAPYFKSKKMTDLQTSIFITERERELRLLGFIGCLLQRIPLIGMIFSISNRIGIAMYAHDLEKRQELFRKGILKPKGAYQSRTALVELDLPRDAIGNFPKKEALEEEEEEEVSEKKLD
ncbi:uncharacterized protein MELLADRAFT_73039 [Melampsora larici-populina 98AG31]|uniref:Uncharacterized protein n=1 Tax=Melampsora larici-populina (strain 98AG31 / pathotype 3-4-7) TaxID=747676 RepID=F4S290_MELLP|nr:uncharacterized protein MELLADRAFT_73039 [Melampsora larici-populina 98AG31]EGG01133.1 hypothetical protein MELLADRAFT_73039 [Melampsora larici-populina 98AG31]